MLELRRIHDLEPAALAPLLAASTAEGFRFVARLADGWTRDGVRYQGPGEILLGGYDGTRLVAVGGLMPDPYGDDPATGRLRHVYVLPAWRGVGVGRRLVQALEAAARGWYDVLVLRTDTAAAARFYERLGYAALPAGGSATHRRSVAPTADGGNPEGSDLHAPLQ